MAAMKPSLGLGRADTLRMEQPIRRRSSPLQTLSLRAFGRPKGVLRKLGGVIMARTNRAIAARVVELLNIRPSDRVLEVGFGPGVGIQLLAEKATSGEVAGIDCSEEMVEQATARNAAAVECGRVELQLGSVAPAVRERNFRQSVGDQFDADLARPGGSAQTNAARAEARRHHCARLYALFGTIKGRPDRVGHYGRLH
jgi:SAM-dependent methyltransferase